MLPLESPHPGCITAAEIKKELEIIQVPLQALRVGAAFVAQITLPSWTRSITAPIAGTAPA